MIEVQAEVHGQDCIAVLVHYTPEQPMVITGWGYGDAIPGDPGEMDWYLVVGDQSASWLEKLLTDADIRRIESEFEAALEAANAEARIA